MNGQVDSKAFVQILVWLEEAAAQSSHTPCLNLRPSCCSYVTAWLSVLWLSALLKDHHISLPAFEMTGLIAIIPHFSIASHWYNVCLIIAKWLDKSYRTIPCLTIRLQRSSGWPKHHHIKLFIHLSFKRDAKTKLSFESFFFTTAKKKI